MNSHKNTTLIDIPYDDKELEKLLFGDEYDDIARDTYYPMKCIKCGFEQKMPDFVYDEEADFKKVPCFHCPKCDKPAFYLKRIALEKLNRSK